MNKTNNPKNISLLQALIPIAALIVMLFYNVFFVFGDEALGGSNQFVLILGAAVAMSWFL